MESMMLVDAHIHTAEISPCSQVPAADLVARCAKEGLGGICLTNHYKASAVRGPFEEWRKRYTDEYRRTRHLGEKLGLKVFFGVEFTLDEMPKNDFTVYGLTEEDIEEAEPLYRLTLRELADYVHGKNALLYHAHPFRNTTPVDGTLLDGTEINCHPLYRGCREADVRAFADRYNLRLSCGSDFHGDTYKPYCGIWVPSPITVTWDFVEYLRNTRRPALTVAPDPTPDMTIAPGTGTRPRSRENG